MSQGLGVQLGLGGGRSATSSGAPAGGGGGGFTNDFSCEFDATDDQLAIGTVGPLGTMEDYTISAWASNTASGAGHWTVFAAGTVPHSATNRLWFKWGDNRFWFYQGGDGVQVTANLVAAQQTGWHHFVAVRDGDYVTLYVDAVAGTPVNFSAVSMPQSGYEGNAKIGCRHDGNYVFPGSIDEVAIWNSALSSSTISDIYNSGAPTDLADLSPFVWYRMGDSAGDTESGGGAASDGGTVGTVVNAANPGTYDASGNNGTLYEEDVPS